MISLFVLIIIFFNVKKNPKHNFLYNCSDFWIKVIAFDNQ
jgi:hypothetical protein